MSIELYFLLFAAVLTGVLWVPVVIGYVSTRGPLQPADYIVAPSTPLPAWVNRANRAHVNAVENLVPFAVVVLVAHAAGVSNETTQVSAMVYFYARVAHAIVHISGFSHFRARTLLFTIAWIAFITFSVSLLRHL